MRDVSVSGRIAETPLERVLQSLRGHGTYIGICALLMLVGSIGGFGYGPQVAPAAENTADDLQTDDAMADRAPLESSVDIFLTNLSVAVGLVVGGLILGVPTVALLLFNGFFLGMLGSRAHLSGNGDVFVLLLAPHGIFELPALWIAGSIGLKLSSGLYRHLRRQRAVVLQSEEVNELVVLATLSLGLLLVAAIVESQVTFSLAFELASES
jgi:uncharacterized membrane protein SpoIIM required for sporulation